MMRLLTVFLLFAAVVSIFAAQTEALLETETIPGEGVWVDPAIGSFTGDEFRVTVWFEQQFLGDGKSYLRRTKEFADIGRIALRKRVVATLKSLSGKSQSSARGPLDRLAAAGEISDLQFHWIVNGFSCGATLQGLDGLKAVPKVKMIYFAGRVRAGRLSPSKASVSKPKDIKPGKFSPRQYPPPWYITALKADRVWREHKVTGQRVLNVVHDGNFILSPGVAATLYRNPREEPNGKDDSGNGLPDDIHGFDFLFNRADLTRTPMPMNSGRLNAGVLHGHQCAAIICGRGTAKSPHQFGIAPESKWAGVLASRRIEAAIEWAIEQDADTYSMSFSIPNLREYRSHWRKMMEHGAYCGVHFVSGAGNFALEGSPRFAPIPVQMRTPEDIPQVVFAAAGVKRDFSRAPFSSQGPVRWETQHYRDGSVDKPEVVAFNYRLPLLLPDGAVRSDAASGNSFAGPMFCGVIALVLSANPDLKPWEVREIIIRTAHDVGPDGYDHQTGHGLIDAHAAVSEALRRRK